MKKFEAKICSCGLCGGDIHGYIWDDFGEKSGPFLDLFAMIITAIQLALKNRISQNQAIEAGKVALDSLPSTLEGEMLPAKQALEILKSRLNDGHNIAEAIFASSIEKEAVLAGMFPSEEESPVKFQPRLCAVGEK